MKILNRIALVGSVISLLFDVYGAFSGSEVSMVWALLMFYIFLDTVKNELEWRNK